MGFKVKDAKILWYATTKHTDELINKIIDRRNDDTLSDSKKKRKIARYATAIVIKNLKRCRIKSFKLATGKTLDLASIIESIYYDEYLSKKQKKKEITKLCLAIAIRRGIINTVDTLNPF